MVEVSGGSHSTAVSYAVSRFFFDVSHKYGVRIRESDYAGKFSFIISSLANKMSPRGQTKDSVDDGYVTENLQDCMYNALYQEWEKGTDWLLKVINSTVEDAHNRIQIAEMSKSLREVEKVTKSLKASNKFISCAAYEKKQYSGLELFIVEGDSAGGRAMTAQNGKNSGNSIDKSEYLSYNLYMGTIPEGMRNSCPCPFLSEEPRSGSGAGVLGLVQTVSID